MSGRIEQVAHVPSHLPFPIVVRRDGLLAGGRTWPRRARNLLQV
jgi:hypothetical protein